MGEWLYQFLSWALDGKIYIKPLAHFGVLYTCSKKQELLLIFGTLSHLPPPDPFSALLFHAPSQQQQQNTNTGPKSLMVWVLAAFSFAGPVFSHCNQFIPQEEQQAEVDLKDWVSLQLSQILLCFWWLVFHFFFQAPDWKSWNGNL